MKTIPVTIENTSVEIGLDINKTGIVQAQPNDEIKYSFNTLKNKSNVALDNFTWTDNGEAEKKSVVGQLQLLDEKKWEEYYFRMQNKN